MKCQNCGFESESKICSICGTEIIEEEAPVAEQILPVEEAPEEPGEIKKEKPKKRIKTILTFILAIILSAAIASVSSIAIYDRYAYNEKRVFTVVNKNINYDKFSLKLKEVKTPTVEIDGSMDITYQFIFEIHNKTGHEIEFVQPQIDNTFGGDVGYGDGMLTGDYYIYDVNGKQNYSVRYTVPAWSSIEYMVKATFNGYNYISLSQEYTSDGILDYDMPYSYIDRNLTYKKEVVQQFIDESPDEIYIFLKNKYFDGSKEFHSKFYAPIDKKAIEIPKENVVD